MEAQVLALGKLVPDRRPQLVPGESARLRPGAGPLEDVRVLQQPEIAAGIGEPVRVIDAEPVDLAFRQQAQRQPVRLLEHVGVFHPHRGEGVDVEEAAVVDLLRRDAPMRQAVSLRVEQLVEQIEAARLLLGPVEDPDVLLQVPADRLASGEQRRYPPLHDFLLPPALLAAGGILLVARGHVLEHEEDALQLVHRLALAQRPLQFLDAVGEDLRIGARVEREEMVVVPDPERPLVELELDLAALEHRPVAVAQHGQ